MTNTISYGTTERNETTEEMNTSLDLNSSVELYFRTDYLPLERLAGPGQIDRIKVNTLNPDAEERAAATERSQRLAASYQSEAARRSELERALQPNAPTTPPAAPSRPASPAKPGGAQPGQAANGSIQNPVPRTAAGQPTQSARISTKPDGDSNLTSFRGEGGHGSDLKPDAFRVAPAGLVA